ncbi:MAG: hypothetical protein WC383_16950 [Gammaproteobacteria bacterium]
MKIKDLGQLVATKAVAELQESNKEFATFVNACLNKYLSNDWGDLLEDDKQMNDQAVKSGDERILAAYSFPPNAQWEAIGGWGTKEDKIWIITEWDRSVTTILFPGEY